MFPINQYVFGLLTTTIIIGALLFASISNTDTLNENISCNQFPKTYFLQKDTEESIKIIQNSILNAKERITIIISDLTYLDFKYVFQNPLSQTKTPKNNIKIILPEDSSIISDLSSIGLSYYYSLQSTHNQIDLSYIVADDSAFMAPFLTKSDNIHQIVSFEDCKTCADDIQSFIDFYVLSEQQKLPFIIPKTLQGKTSAIMPLSLGNKTLFTFFNHDDIIFPLRITTNDVIEKAFEEMPKDLYIFTQRLLMLSEYTGYEATQFSLYLQIKALLFTGNTRIHFLARNKTVINEKNSVWCHSLSNFDNFEIRVYGENYAGPDFMIADDWVYIFSHQIKSHEINEDISLHYATNDFTTLNYTKNYFEVVWEESTQCV